MWMSFTGRVKSLVGSRPERTASATPATPISHHMHQQKDWDLASIAADVEAPPVRPPRTPIRAQEYICLVTLIILLTMAGLSVYSQTLLLMQIGATWQWISLASIPLGFVWFSFAAKTFITSLFGIFFRSVRAMEGNSEFYSAVKTPVLGGKPLPPVIVQIAVYKESLKEVIEPTYRSVAVAMERYFAAGGRVKVFINDDGLKLVGPEEFVARTQFYKEHEIGFVARPGEGRKGIFKKASNMNFCLHVANQVSELLASNLTLHPSRALVDIWKAGKKDYIAGGDLSIPDDTIILLLDADTRVPPDCITDTMGEFIDSPSLPYTQHFTTPFSDQCTNYWERMISHFTKKIYMGGIALGCSLGDHAPLVGHNAFLRWAAVKKVAWFDEEDQKTKYWSEDKVSEDFDLSMRLSAANMFGRYAMYTGYDFQEGVSLTYTDEIIKWRKFGFGACEMVFNRFKEWPRRGPFSPLITSYLGTPSIPWYQKFSMMCYLSSYFAMGCTLYVVLLEAACSIVAPKFYDDFQVRSFDVMLTCMFIFGVVTLVADSILYWRMSSLKGVNILSMIFKDFIYIVPMAVFFSSAQFPLTTAMWSYFFDTKIVWGATVKEVNDMTCFKALHSTLNSFRLQYVVMSLLLGGYSFAIYWYGIGVYEGWALMFYTCAHLAGPIILNPYITSLSF